MNVAFVEQITITIANNDNRREWNTIQQNLIQKYNANVTIQVNENIQSSDAGGANMGKATSSYGNISYKVSGVTNGSRKKAAKGAL